MSDPHDPNAVPGPEETAGPPASPFRGSLGPGRAASPTEPPAGASGPWTPAPAGPPTTPPWPIAPPPGGAHAGPPPTVVAAAPPTVEMGGPGGDGPSSPRRRRWLLVAAGVVGLGGAGFMVARGLGGDSGGASSPEAAVQQLVDAVNSEDPVGAADVLAPDEVSSLGEIVKLVEGRASSSGVGGEKRATSGLDLSIDDVELRTRELSDDVARVEVRRLDATWSLTAADLGPAGKRAASGDEKGTFDQDDLVRSVWDEERGDDREIDPFVIAVRRNGGWYVSLTYTMAAYLADANGYDAGDFDSQPRGLKGADSPEDAVVDFTNSLEKLDPDETLDTVSPAEFSVLWAYRDAIDEAIDEQTADGSSFELEVEDQDLRVDDAGGRYKKVWIDGASGTFSTTNGYGEQESWEWEADGWCLEVDGSDGRDKNCLDRSGDTSDAWADQFDAFGIDEPYVLVEEANDGWVVSPVATILDYARTVVPKIGDAWLYHVLGPVDFAPASATVEVGVEYKGTLNETGDDVIDVALEKGSLVRVSVDGDDDVWVSEWRGPTGHDVWLDSSSPVSTSGTYRIALGGDPGSSYELVVGTAEDGQLDGSTATGELDAVHPIRRYPLSIAADQRLKFSIDGDVEVEVVGGEDGYTDCYYMVDGETCELERGDYELVVSTYGEPTSYSVTLSEVEGPTIDGSDSVEGFLVRDDTAFHDFDVPAGVTAVVTLESASGEDLDLGCESGCEEFSGSYSGYEEIEISGPASGQLGVYALGDDSYTLTIEER